MSRRSALLILVLIVGLSLPSGAEAEFSNLQLGLEDELVATGVPQPTAIDWLPGGDTLLIASQQGRVFQNDGTSTAVEEVLDLSSRVCTNANETGLLGLAVDPEFGSGQEFVYVYYTARKGSCGDNERKNRVSRFATENDGTIDEGSEEVLIDNISAKGGNHNGGDIQFGKDGLLYVSVGDAGEDLATGETQNDNRNARRLSLLNGKILRIEPDGDIPASNPFTGNGTRRCGATGDAAARSEVKAEKKGRKKHKNKKKKRRQQRKKRQLRNAGACQEIFATGLRNPFRIAFDPDDTSGPQRFYINDVGGGAWEEIDEGKRGADYGWNVREGPCPTGQSNCTFSGGGFELPVFAYRLSTGCRTITGGAFVPDDSAWPDDLEDAYLFADFGCGGLFALTDEEISGDLPAQLGSGSDATQLKFGPGDALYYTTFSNGGQVRRIVPVP